MRVLVVGFLVLLVSACATPDTGMRLDREVGQEQVFASADTVESVRALKPQASAPIRVAILPPRGYRGSLSNEEREIILGWTEELKSIGLLSSASFVPSSLLPRCGYNSGEGCFIEQARVAGARMGADALLLINGTSVSDSWSNPLSMLNLTIVGMWLAPGHHRATEARFEAVLMDVNNSYLYASAEGSGSSRNVRPLVYARHDLGRDKARSEALEELGRRLVAMGREEMRRLEASSTAEAGPAESD